MPRAEREQLILDVAGQVFARSGYFSSSMDEIADLAEVSKPLLYAYFGSKEGLYGAYIDRTGEELVDRLVRAGRDERDELHRLKARIEEFLAFVEQYRDGWTVLFSELASIRPVADRVASLRAEVALAIRRMIDAASPHVRLDADASDAVAHAIVGAGESLANWWLEHSEVPRDRVVEWYVQIVKASLTAQA